MRKHEIVQALEGLFPPDAPYADTRTVGTILLIRAIREHDWRDLPEPILTTFLSLAESEDSNSNLSRTIKREGIGDGSLIDAVTRMLVPA